jgi:hypothetical protein
VNSFLKNDSKVSRFVTTKKKKWVNTRFQWMNPQFYGVKF